VKKKLETLLRETKEMQKKHDKQTTDKQTNNSC